MVSQTAATEGSRVRLKVAKRTLLGRVDRLQRKIVSCVNRLTDRSAPSAVGFEESEILESKGVRTMRRDKAIRGAHFRSALHSAIVLTCLFWAAASWAAPRFYVSPNPTGPVPGAPLVVGPNQIASVFLFVQPDPANSVVAPYLICGSGTGDELCAIEFSLAASDDLSIVSFTPEPGQNVVHELGPTALQGNWLDPFAPTTQLKRLGSLQIQASASATTGEIVATAGGVDTALQIVPMELAPTMGPLIVVPEPATSLLLLSGIALLGLLGKRRLTGRFAGRSNILDAARAGLSYSMVAALVLQPAFAGFSAVPVATAAPASPEQPASPRPQELSGFLDDQSARKLATRSAPENALMAEDGTMRPASAVADLPVIDEKLSSRLRTSRAADEMVRVIVHLDYLPHTQVFTQVLSEHRDEIRNLESERSNLLGRLKVTPDEEAVRDSDHYSKMFAMTNGEQAELRSVSQENERLGTIIKSETTRQLKQLIDADQAPVQAVIRSLGGEVEFSMIAGNMMVAQLPASAIEAFAKTEGVVRIVEDQLMTGHLANAATSTMVDPADPTLSGLWDNGHTGGIYDPAIIDSGMDLNHPGMTDSADRTNFCTWYLVAANGSANFDDQFTCDDLQGHGTHVSGIVGSYGTSSYPNHLGTAYGVEKMVHLKAGWRNGASGRASMFWSDMYNVVDRALNNVGALQPSNTFADDVDGFNLSYGGETTLDDTDASRFWDSVISTYADLPVTVSAGNSGPTNTLFSDPGLAYNVITVANANDRGTSSRNDDLISSGSTVGPTASGRKKPDIAAPGTSISAPNHNWETQPDYVNKSGTSMAAPMVLGVIMDLMDAGVFDELALKALLINTAQKNLPGMDIEGDFDGWDPAIGWGMMNAYAAYFHRFDVFTDSLTPRNTEGEYQLYRGIMRDEGPSGEGRDRVTMVWNRHATYLDGATPTESFSLVDMNLRLYAEETEALIDTDLNAIDNVHQVRIGAGAPDTPVVVRAYAWSTNFSHGDASERIAVATEEGFERVERPETFQGIALWPTEVEPNELFNIEFWLRNDSELASHNNVFDLELPAGFTLVSGVDTQDVGSAAGSGGNTVHVNYTVRAPAASAASQNLVVKHSHVSYGVEYGDYNWNMGVTVAVDTTPPNPNPMTFSTPPDQASTSSISMVGSFASDIHDPVTFYHDFTSSPTLGTGGSDSGWVASRSYTDTGLQTNEQYCYRVWARDAAKFPNLTTPSGIQCAYTGQAAGSAVVADGITTTSMGVRAAAAPPNLSSGSSGLEIVSPTAGTSSGWNQDNLTKNFAGLTPASGYKFYARARNGDADVGANGTEALFYTLANFPAAGALTSTSGSSISVSLNPNGNGSGAQYLIENTTTGASSGWQSGTTWSSGGLECETAYNFQARARNPVGVETLIVPLGSALTGGCLDSDADGIMDTADNCPFEANPLQEDFHGVGASSGPDGIGDACQCGDTTDDGLVDDADVSTLRAELVGAGPGMTPGGFEKCGAGMAGSCSLVDAVIISRAVDGLSPGIAPVCGAALP